MYQVGSIKQCPEACRIKEEERAGLQEVQEVKVDPEQVRQGSTHDIV